MALKKKQDGFWGCMHACMSASKRMGMNGIDSRDRCDTLHARLIFIAAAEELGTCYVLGVRK